MTFKLIADALANDGFCISPRFLATAAVAALARDAHANRSRFQPAGVGEGERHALRPQVRGDSTLWIEPPGQSSAQRTVLARFEALRLALNRALQLGLFDFECHFALYPPAAGYRRHLDRFTGRDSSAGERARVLSCVLYLNREWGPEDRGQLRLYRPGAAPLDIPPQGGTLVTFLSDRFEHEVVPARRERLSLTGWFRRRAAQR
ncbi:MAG TPA: 2OG-Fe(II) oxygenase [Burkholderiales bacterium]|nr:2OG-Fe(II) oxygenase [Burkholderiales bacterium]